MKKTMGLIETAEHWGVEIFEIREDIKSYDGDITDVNSWFHSTISLTFYKVLEGLEEFIEENIEDEEENSLAIEKLEELRDDFSPFINYLDSWFNNILDEIDLTEDHEEVFKAITKAFLEL